jgi:hypothetical protein
MIHRSGRSERDGNQNFTDLQGTSRAVSKQCHRLTPNVIKLRMFDREAVVCLVCRACSKTNGCEEYDLKSPRSRDDRNPKAESKGVYREIESEGS